MTSKGPSPLAGILFGIVLLAVAAIGAEAAPTVRVKDIAYVQGVRDNQLLGVGLVTGLAGQGDSSNSEVLRTTLANLFARFGISVVADDNDPRARVDYDASGGVGDNRYLLESGNCRDHVLIAEWHLDIDDRRIPRLHGYLGEGGANGLRHGVGGNEVGVAQHQAQSAVGDVVGGYRPFDDGAPGNGTNGAHGGAFGRSQQAALRHRVALAVRGGQWCLE